jgi:hypothetical protein
MARSSSPTTSLDLHCTINSSATQRDFQQETLFKPSNLILPLGHRDLVPSMILCIQAFTCNKIVYRYYSTLSNCIICAWIY